MTTEEKLKLVAEFDGWEHGYGVIWNQDGRAMSCKGWEYHTSWDWQIPVWAKLYESGWTTTENDNLYRMAVSFNNPSEGFEIIVQIIQRINKSTAQD